MTRDVDAHRKARRMQLFRGHDAWARRGAFSARLDDRGGNERGPIVCGVCGEDFTDAQVKAAHLEEAHGAIVRTAVSPHGELMWEWAR